MSNSLGFLRVIPLGTLRLNKLLRSELFEGFAFASGMFFVGFACNKPYETAGIRFTEPS